MTTGNRLITSGQRSRTRETRGGPAARTRRAAGRCTHHDVPNVRKEHPVSIDEFPPYTAEELAAEGVTGLPAKEVISILDLAADVDLAIDGAAPIDLAVALNANVVAPIDASVSANLLSDGSMSQALADQGVMVNQTVA